MLLLCFITEHITEHIHTCTCTHTIQMKRYNVNTYLYMTLYELWQLGTVNGYALDDHRTVYRKSVCHVYHQYSCGPNNEHKKLFPMEYCGWSIKLSIHLYIVLILRMPGVHCHFPLCQMYPVQKAPSPPCHHPVSSRSILILFAYLHIGFPSSLFPSDVPTKQYMHLSPMHATCTNPSHPPSFDHHNNIWQAATNPIT